jgi:integrase
MSGHVTKRGKNSWRLKFDIGADPDTGRRRIRYHTVKGSTKKEAAEKLTLLLAANVQGEYVDASKVTVGDFVSGRVTQWQDSGEITARSAGRYHELVKNQIQPFLGNVQLQKLRAIDVERWHTSLRNGGRVKGGGLAPRTIGHAHRILVKALKEAVKFGEVVKNVASLQSAPRADEAEMAIVKDVHALLKAPALRSHWLYMPSVIALFTGMRLGEVLALHWSRVALDRKVIEVREALEETVAHGVRFKAPKSKAGRRDITLPDVLVGILRDYRRDQLELRIKLGVGKLQDEQLLFAELDAKPVSQKKASGAWGRLAAQLGMPEVSFHCLRHTHASQLIDAGVDIVTISKRLGHAKPSVTLKTYAHLFRNDDSKASAAINAVF